MTTPYSEGFRAHVAEKPIHQNPYAPFTSEHSQWEDGWIHRDQHINALNELLDSFVWGRKSK